MKMSSVVSVFIFRGDVAVSRLFYVAFQIFFEFFFVNGVFSPKKLQI